jgi:hypothetical protein
MLNSVTQFLKKRSHDHQSQEWIVICSNWFIIYGFTSHSRMYHLYGDVTITGEGLQSLGLCSALRAFEKEGIFIVPHLLWHGAWGLSFFSLIWRTTPFSRLFTTHMGTWSIYSNLNPHGSAFSGLLRHTRGCWGPILTRILMDICN